MSLRKPNDGGFFLSLKLIARASCPLLGTTHLKWFSDAIHPLRKMTGEFPDRLVTLWDAPNRIN
ncbi:hypothetical protein [Aestuariivivens sediminis]|uniref:hypothetical protein n=1 Tax=Aestuariivivens sediminis TaxID=2913557 RepID=UPI001F5AAA7E|nr:hypothetical protein [Aestuariivivens sediminis]